MRGKLLLFSRCIGVLIMVIVFMYLFLDQYQLPQKQSLEDSNQLKVTNGQLSKQLSDELTMQKLFGKDALIKFVDEKFFCFNEQLNPMNTFSYEHVAPVIFKFPGFTKKMMTTERWQGDPFFAFWRGYKMHFSVYPGGNGEGEGTHLSLYLHLMKGPYDDRLEQSGYWPLRGTFKIELLDQLNDNNHVYYLSFDNAPNSFTDRVIEKSRKGWGNPIFLSHSTLFSSSYLKHDKLYFQISYQYNNASKHSNDIIPYELAIPMVFKVHGFTKMMETKNTIWWSEHFFAFSKGYKMRLGIDANCNGNGEGSHVSVYLQLLKGPYDDILEQSGHWPLIGIFKIELLDQVNDDNYVSYMLLNGTSSDFTSRVREQDMAPVAKGISKFISHNNILFSNYLKYDRVHFRISYYNKSTVVGMWWSLDYQFL